MVILLIISLASACALANGQGVDDGLSIEARARLTYARLGRSVRWGDLPRDAK